MYSYILPFNNCDQQTDKSVARVISAVCGTRWWTDRADLVYIYIYIICRARVCRARVNNEYASAAAAGWVRLLPAIVRRADRYFFHFFVVVVVVVVKVYWPNSDRFSDRFLVSSTMSSAPTRLKTVYTNKQDTTRLNHRRPPPSHHHLHDPSVCKIYCLFNQLLSLSVIHYSIVPPLMHILLTCKVQFTCHAVMCEQHALLLKLRDFFGPLKNWKIATIPPADQDYFCTYHAIYSILQDIVTERIAHFIII